MHTGQHYDAEMSDVFLAELGLPKPDVFLGVGSGTHGEQTAKALVGIEQVLLERRPDLVVVPGDVNSTLAGALAAAKLHIPVAHLEAGLRSFDRTMPEEHNRLLTDHLSDVLLLHSESAFDNLDARGDRPRQGPFRREHDDRLGLRAPRAREAPRSPGARSASNRARTGSSRCTARRSSTIRRS